MIKMLVCNWITRLPCERLDIMWALIDISPNTHGNRWMMGCPWSRLLSLRASDLVMKIDALLAAAPKGEVRRDVHFIKDSHRWAELFSLFTFLLLLRLPCRIWKLLWHHFKHSRRLKLLLWTSAEQGLFDLVSLNPLWHAVLLLSVLHLSPREHEVFYDVVAIVDPLTREAQKMSSLLIVSFILVSPLIRFLIWLGGLKKKGRAQ